MRHYDRPNPHSLGDAGAIYRQQKQEKEDFKREELKKEPRQEDRGNDTTDKS